MRITIIFLLLTQSLFAASDTSRVHWDTLRMIEMPEWSSYFSALSTEGTMIVYDQQKGKYFIYNRDRFHKRFLPASTFKIFNSLVAIETKVVKNENEVLEWDGFTRGNSNWDRSQNMKFAFANSTVWFYQELARRIGFEKMEEFIGKSSYGNKDISGGIDQFWLKGKLRISAWEQIDFLKKLQADLLPFSKETMSVVKNIMIEEKIGEMILRAKTGWGDGTDPDIGWYVGYVEKTSSDKEKKKQYYYFALNMDMKSSAKGEDRKIIAKRVLSDLKIL